MIELHRHTLGEAWLAAMREVYCSGHDLDGRSRELLNLCVSYARGDLQDLVLARFGSRQQIEEMRKVFFSVEENQFGHSYHDGFRGPNGKNDLSDVVSLLRQDPFTKRAVATLNASCCGKVPCINVMHFLIRESSLYVTYFSRGQDMYQKFYADGVCIFDIALHAAKQLGVAVASVTGMISSAHVYLKDLPDIRVLLTEAQALQLQETI